MSSEDEIKSINVVAATSYDGPETPVHVNCTKPLKLSTDDFDVYLIVRVRNFAHDKTDPEDQEESLKYFEDPKHKDDSFSVQFTVVFKKDVKGNELTWGNDWDVPIRDILPWGFSAAFSAFKYAVDPGVDGDLYADKPWVYGAALSSINYLQEQEPGTDLETVLGPITETDASARYKKYLNKDNLKQFTFEKGKAYTFDFSNHYLDMSTTPKIKLPGFTLDVGKYAGITKLRYVLKVDQELVFAVSFSADK